MISGSIHSKDGNQNKHDIWKLMMMLKIVVVSTVEMTSSTVSVMSNQQNNNPYPESLLYTGVGSRTTPEPILKLMEFIGSVMTSQGLVLRSGSSTAADRAFELGASKYANEFTKPHIYLPYPGYERSSSWLSQPSQQALDGAETMIPHWDTLTLSQRLLEASKLHQVGGYYLNTPSRFMICWTPNGSLVPTVSTTIKAAEYLNIPILNLGLDHTDNFIEDWINQYL